MHRGLGARPCSQCSSFGRATMWHERGDFLHFNAQQMWNCSDETPLPGAIACRFRRAQQLTNRKRCSDYAIFKSSQKIRIDSDSTMAMHVRGRGFDCEAAASFGSAIPCTLIVAPTGLPAWVQANGPYGYRRAFLNSRLIDRSSR